jgi:uncharacterized NAD(P)/FAD-binding protein YdhS
MEFDIAIVGAGASGLLSIAHLGRVAARHGIALHVALIDPAPDSAVGLAYSTTRPEHLMNVRACALTAFDDEPDHFVEWMAAQGTPIHPHGFAPRMMFGRYLRSVADSTWGGVTVERIHQRCLGVGDAPTSGAISLTLEDGRQIVAGQLILALGNARPVPLAGSADVVIDDPWDETALARIQPGDDVVIVGTGLTAVDTMLALDTSGHRGRRTVVSRHGRWPGAHALAPSTCTVPAARSFDFAARGVQPTARSIVAALRSALRDRGSEDWQGVVDRVRPHTVRLWRSLDDAERARFIRHARPMWESHRHRMAPVIAEQLQLMLQDADTTTVAARIVSIQTDDGRAAVQIDQHGDARTLDARWVINCTGPSADIRRRSDPLVQSLLTNGHAQPGWRGWGFDVDECGRMQRCSTLGAAMISAIGPLRLGADFETIAIPEIRVQAASVALRLIEQHVHAQVA